MLPRKTGQHLKAVFGQMLHRLQTSEKINPAAITRVDYDRARAKIFDVGLTYENPGRMVSDGEYLAPHQVGTGKGRGLIKIAQGRSPGTMTHELEHSLGYDIKYGEFNGPQDVLFELSQKYPEFLEKLKQSVEPSLKSLIASDPEIASDWYTTRGPQAVPEAARAMIRLFNHGPQDLRTDIARIMPVSHEMLKRVPPELAQLLTPYDEAQAAAEFAAKMGY